MKLSSGIYTASKQRKARTKTASIKFLMSRNIRSLCNTTHSNERYVPITGYRRHNCTRTKYIDSLGHHKFNLLPKGFYSNQFSVRFWLQFIYHSGGFNQIKKVYHCIFSCRPLLTNSCAKLKLKFYFKFGFLLRMNLSYQYDLKRLKETCNGTLKIFQK